MADFSDRPKLRDNSINGQEEYFNNWAKSTSCSKEQPCKFEERIKSETLNQVHSALHNSPVRLLKITPCCFTLTNFSPS